MAPRPNLRLHKPFSREDFERVLWSTSAVREYPDWLYEVDWFEDAEDGWKRQNVTITECCYILPLTFKPTRLLKIYSSVSGRTSSSRDCGSDAVRIVLADQTGEPVHSRFTRINRTGNRRQRLRVRISEALQALGIDMTCPDCGKKLFLKRNSKNNSRFIGCSTFPKCEYKRNFPILPEESLEVTHGS